MRSDDICTLMGTAEGLGTGGQLNWSALQALMAAASATTVVTS